MFRLPGNAKNPYSSRKSTGAMSGASEDAAMCANAVEEKLNLEEELFRLRESTKAALQQSWDEVETLQQQCVVHLQFTSELEEQLMEARKNEDAWRIRCLAAEVRMQSSPEDENNHVLTANNKLNICQTMRAWSRTPNHDSITSWKEPRLSVPQTPGEYAQSADNQKDEQIKELLLKLSSRHEAIISLEHTVEQHVRAMQYTQAETLCSMETQRIKEKHLSESHRRQEERLEKVVEFHRKQLIGKEASIDAHQKKLADYRIYIEELTTELAKVLQVVQDIEERGGLLNYSSSKRRSSIVKEKTKDSIPQADSLVVDTPCNESKTNMVTEKTEDYVPEAVSFVGGIPSNESISSSGSPYGDY